MQFFVFGLCNRRFSIDGALFRAGALIPVNTVYSILKNREQYLQAKSRRKKPQTQLQKHQIQEIFKFFLYSRSVKSVREGVFFHVDPSGNVKKSSSKIKFRMD